MNNVVRRLYIGFIVMAVIMAITLGLLIADLIMQMRGL